MKIDIGAKNTFTKDDLKFMINAIQFYGLFCATRKRIDRGVKCVGLLQASLDKLKRRK